MEQIEKPPVLSLADLDTICRKAGLGNADWDEGGGYVPESVVRVIQQAKAEVAREIFEEIEATALWHNKVLHYNPDAWESLKSKHLRVEK